MNKNEKKKQGVFYTPSVIADFICRQTIVPFFSNKNSKSSHELLNEFLNMPDNLKEKIEKIKIIDPSCGEGVFLVRTAEILMELYNKIPEIRNSTLNLEVSKNRNRKLRYILENNILGIDIDRNSVESTKTNILHEIKQVLTENQDIIDLNKSIQCGDALSNIFNEKKYNIVIGNPPFFEIMKSSDFKKNFPELEKDLKPNIASLFLIKYLKLLNKNGVLAFIFPASILFSDTFSNLRNLIVKKYTIIKIVQLGRVFSEVGLEQIIIFIQNKKPNDIHNVQVIYNIKNKQLKKYEELFVKQQHFINDKKNRLMIYMDDEIASMIQNVNKRCIPLEELVFFDSTNKNYLGIFRGMGWEKQLSKKKSKNQTYIAIKGENIMRYGLKNSYFLPDHLSKKESYKLNIIRKKKVILQCIVSSRTRIVATKDEKGLVTLSTVENIVLKPDSSISLSFLTGILNSDFITYYVIDHIFIRSRLTTKLDKKYMIGIPIPVKIKPQLIKEIEIIVNKLEKVVELGINNGMSVNTIENNKNYIKLNFNLNEKVYEAFGLTNDEINNVKKKIDEFYGIIPK